MSIDAGPEPIDAGPPSSSPRAGTECYEHEVGQRGCYKGKFSVCTRFALGPLPVFFTWVGSGACPW